MDDNLDRFLDELHEQSFSELKDIIAQYYEIDRCKVFMAAELNKIVPVMTVESELFRLKHSNDIDLVNIVYLFQEDFFLNQGFHCDYFTDTNKLAEMITERDVSTVDKLHHALYDYIEETVMETPTYCRAV